MRVRPGEDAPVTVAEFVTARLDEDERRADAMEHFAVYEQPFYSCPASRTEPYGDLEWGEDACDCCRAGFHGLNGRSLGAPEGVLDPFGDMLEPFGHGLGTGGGGLRAARRVHRHAGGLAGALSHCGSLSRGGGGLAGHGGSLLSLAGQHRGCPGG
jgi:hypothetical protein